MVPGQLSSGTVQWSASKKISPGPSFPKRGGGSSMFSVIDDNLSLLLHSPCSEKTYE